MNIALHPAGDFAAVLCAGYGEHEVVLLDLKKNQRIASYQVPQAFYGLTFDRQGESLYASGGDKEVIHRWKWSVSTDPTTNEQNVALTEHRQLRIVNIKEKMIPAGIATAPDGQTIYVACCWGHRLATLDAQGLQAARFLELPEGSYPYGILLNDEGKTAFVSLWGDSKVLQINLANQRIERELSVDSHPTEMLLSQDRRRLFVACANSNNVHVVDLESGKTLEIIASSLYPLSPSGSTPNSISLDPSGKVLLIANATNNNVAVIDVSESGRSKSLGFIPVGWYPTSVRFTADGENILVANGKGILPKSNRHGPKPTQREITTLREYIGRLFTGTIAFVPSPSPAAMARLTKEAYQCSPLLEDAAPRTEQRSANHPIPAKVGDPSPIRHCIYIVKENRTYDQVLGDMAEGNGDANLCLFPEKITPNHHALAREFVLLDNFYVEGEVSADGHEWSMAAYATDFIEKSWPLTYRPGDEGKIGYPSEGSYKIATPKGGYIWDRCREAQVSYYSFGEFIANGPKPGDPGTAKVPGLEGHFDPGFRSYDLNYPDVKRADRFIEKLQEFEQQGEMPRMIILRLPNDHTSGTSPGKLTPTAMVADNDLAFGRVVEAISKSKFWPTTAIFVVEDDAQNGSDHVDAHRTVAYAISPYTKRRSVDSSFYSTSSMLRTMELILGLQPMSQFDAAALPMYRAFQEQPDNSPYSHRTPDTDLSAVNPPNAWGAKISLELDLAEEDRADDLLFNEVIWRSVKGPDSPMPPPVRAAFVFEND